MPKAMSLVTGCAGVVGEKGGTVLLRKEKMNEKDGAWRRQFSGASRLKEGQMAEWGNWTTGGSEKTTAIRKSAGNRGLEGSGRVEERGQCHPAPRNERLLEPGAGLTAGCAPKDDSPGGPRCAEGGDSRGTPLRGMALGQGY